VSSDAVKQCIRKVFFHCSITKWTKRRFTVFNPPNPPMIEVKYGGFEAQMGLKTAIFYINHEWI
jgi:hypothetical protein